jgi:MFS family permease
LTQAQGDTQPSTAQPEHDTATEAPPAGPPQTHDAYGSLRYRDFRLLLIGVLVAQLGQQMVTVALGWELYNRTGSALALGGVGLAQVIPVILLSLPAGHIVDHASRKRVLILAEIALALGSLGLAALSFSHGALWLIYGCLVALGGAQAFASPASTALIAQIIPEHAFANAMTWRSSVFQLSSVLGPAAGGALVAILHGASWVYVISALATLLFTLLLLPVQIRYHKRAVAAERTLDSLAEGVRFLLHSPVILAAITLDLFAVLLGGATTLEPIFARDILHVGPVGLGWMRAASSVGALCMALILAHRPPFQRAGRALLLAVSAFGLATIIFGLSHSFGLTLAMLFLVGAFDNVSVVIRSTLLLVRTPNELRGRVGAVNWLFISSSNQLGGFESGLAAQFFSPVVSVVGGGLGTLLVVALVAWHWPEMRRLTTLVPSDG